MTNKLKGLAGTLYAYTCVIQAVIGYIQGQYEASKKVHVCNYSSLNMNNYIYILLIIIIILVTTNNYNLTHYDPILIHFWIVKS